MPTTIHIDISDAQKIAQKHGLAPHGKVQKFFTSEIMRKSDPYTPFKTGVLKNGATMTDDGTGITYNTPYARYLWYGKLMVDPKTGKGAFHNPVTGRFWSRRGVAKVLTDRDLNFNGAPLRGSKWVLRAWNTNKTQIIQATEDFANK